MNAARCIFRVTLAQEDGAAGQHRLWWTNIELPFDSIEAIVAQLNAGYVVVGDRLSVRKVGPGELEVTGRRPIALGARGVASIEVPRVRFVEYEEEDAA